MLKNIFSFGKLAFVLSFMILSLAFSSLTVNVATSSDAKVTAGSLSLNVGETGDVPVSVSDLPSSGLGAYDIKIIFNSSVIEVLDVLGGSPPFNSTPVKKIDNLIGEVTFNHFITAVPGPTDIIIAYLKVKAIGSPGSSSSLDITKADLVASDGTSISSVWVSGSVSIVIPRSPSNISLSLDMNTIRIDESVMVYGAIIPAHSSTVNLVFKRPNGSEIYEAVSSSGDGSYSYNFKPDMAGIWTVSSSWSGDSDHYGASSSPASFTVTKLNSSLSITVQPNILGTGETLQIKGYLFPAHAGSIIHIWYRTLEGTWTKIAEAKIDESGAYSYSWRTPFTTPAVYEVKVSWEGDWDHEGAESLPEPFQVFMRTNLSIWLSSNSTSVNGSVVVWGNLSPIYAYANISVLVEAPNGTLLIRNVLTDANGNYRMKFTPDSTGIWRFRSYWPGGGDALPCESLEAELKVVEVGSSIVVHPDARSATLGSNINLSGRIEPAVEGASVTLTLTKPDGNLVILYAQSTGDGCFSTYYIPDQAGFWLVEASWNGNADYGGATSVQEGFNVKKLQSQISLLWSPPIPVRGDILRLRGVLIPKGLEATVNVLVSDDDGKSWTVAASSKTTPNGEYYAELRIEKAGILLLKTVWEGNEYYSACVSPVLRLAVNDEVLSRTVKFSDNSEAKILLSTDVSAATFDLDVSNGRIDIHLADPVQDGTEALVNIFIPEKMLEYYGRSISDLAFAVDGSPITPEFIGSMGGYFAAVQCGRNLTISIYFLTYSLTVNVKDSQGNDISGANVSLNGPVTLNGFTDDSGIVCFNQLPRGEYSIEVHYGPKIGEYRLGISGDASAVFSTPITLRYVDLVLIKEEETMKALMYLFLAVIVAFTVFTVSHESREARFK